jgi:CubicO group peptidase (beta-lactamase class C family)
MRKILRWALGGVAALAVAAGLVVWTYWDTIQDYRAALEYADSFKPDVIDQNFRSLFVKYPSIRVPKSALASPLEKQERPVPENYSFAGENRSVEDWIERTQTTGLIVIRDGAIVHERYLRGNGPETQSIAMSLSKSFVSALVGRAVEDGLIDISQPVDSYAPVLAEGGYKGVSVRNVLQMSSGIGFNEDYGDLNSDIVRYIIQILRGSVTEFTAHLKNDIPQGTVNRYVSADTQVLGLVLEGATGKPLADYFNEVLWSKLGTEADAYWLADQKGEAIAAGGLNAVLRDYARFGLLYLNEGRTLSGEQIVPVDWVKASTTPDAPHLMPGRDDGRGGKTYGYGYQWWIPAERKGGDFTGVGIYGQFIYINPERKVVIAKTSAYADYNNTGQEMKRESIAAFQAIAEGL